MGKEMTSPTQIEALISKINGVVSCKVVIDENRIDEVHILAGNDKPVKKLIRDVETVIKSRTEFDIDHRKISIAQIETNDEHLPKEVRPILKSLRIELIEGYVSVSVELEYDDLMVVGEAKARGKNLERPKLVALATLSALEKLTGDGCVLTLDQLLFVPVGIHEVCLADISAHTQGQEKKLLGAAMAEADQCHAAAKAVLAAINRQFHFFVQKS
jgi:hypothetical protein